MASLALPHFSQLSPSIPKYSEKIQALLKSDRNNAHFTRRPIYIYDNISLNSSYNEKCFRKNMQIKSKHTFCVE